MCATRPVKTKVTRTAARTWARSASFRRATSGTHLTLYAARIDREISLLSGLANVLTSTTAASESAAQQIAQHAVHGFFDQRLLGQPRRPFQHACQHHGAHRL